MSFSNSSNISQWLPLLVIPLLFIVILGLSCWYGHRKKNSSKSLNPLSSTTYRTGANPSSQLTTTDKLYLDQLVRTASDRSIWKRDILTKIEGKKLRKVPSGLIEEKN